MKNLLKLVVTLRLFSMSAYRPFEADDDSGSTVSFYTSRTGTAITSSGGIVKPRFRGQPQVKPPPGPPGVNATGTGRDGIMDDNDDYNDDLSSMASMGRGRGRGRGYRVPNQIWGNDGFIKTFVLDRKTQLQLFGKQLRHKTSYKSDFMSGEFLNQQILGFLAYFTNFSYLFP